MKQPSEQARGEAERPAAQRAPAVESIVPAGPAQGLSPTGLLELQRSAGNHSVARALAAGPTLARWRDFARARGTPQSGYKIFEGNHETAGKYHLKFHNIDRLDAFDEIHVVFEDKAPHAYFYYTDDGVLIPEKSGSGLKHEGLEAIAKMLVDEQLATSDPVPVEEIEAKRKKRAEQEAKDAEVAKQWKAEAEAEYEAFQVKQAEKREASKTEADEETHIVNFLRDMSLGEGEKVAFMLYLDGKGAARGYWKAKADWYKAKRDSGWKIELPPQRVPKTDRITAAKVRSAHSLPAKAEVKITSTKSGTKFFNDSAVITFPNYTTYAATALAEKPPS